MNQEPINKKQYQAPVVKKVHLEVKNAVLSTCRVSGVMDMDGNSSCHGAGEFGTCNI